MKTGTEKRIIQTETLSSQVNGGRECSIRGVKLVIMAAIGGANSILYRKGDADGQEMDP